MDKLKKRIEEEMSTTRFLVLWFIGSIIGLGIFYLIRPLLP